MFVTNIRIKNFRCLKDVTLELNNTDGNTFTKINKKLNIHLSNEEFNELERDIKNMNL